MHFVLKYIVGLLGNHLRILTVVCLFRHSFQMAEKKNKVLLDFPSELTRLEDASK